MYQNQFVPRIEDGSKSTTIRARRKRKVNIGDILDNRRWTGKPYCSKQERIGLYECVESSPVFIRYGEVRVDAGAFYYFPSIEIFAEDDGFKNFEAMSDWFDRNHEGLPFEGFLYRWKPIPEPLAGRLAHYFDKGKNCGNCAKGKKCFAVCASHCRDWAFDWEGAK